MNRSEVMKKAWVYRKAGKTWSESLKKAYADYELDHLFDHQFDQPVVSTKPRKPLVLDMRYSGDVGKLRGMLAQELATGHAYNFRIA